MTTTAALAVLRAEPHLSVSAISTYLRCPAQFAHRYIWRTTPAHRPGVLAFGAAVHEALAVFYAALRDGLPEPTTADLGQAFANAWDQQLGGDLPVLLDKSDTTDTLRDKGIAMLAAFHAQVERPHRVVGVEEPFSIELQDSDGQVLAPRLVGVFDAIVQNEDGGYAVVEHKTAARRWTEQRIATDMQLTAYTMASPLIGLGNATVTVQVLLKTKSPAVEIYRPSRTQRDHRDLLDTARGVHRAVEAGAFYPKPDWQCASCPFAGPCRAG
jgi:putative RecB family exonuclease